MIDLDTTPDGMEREAREAAPTAPVDPWLARRLYGFGASEIGALLYALGRCTPEEAAEPVPKYARDNARTLFAQKAGLRRAGKVSVMIPVRSASATCLVI